MALHNAIFFFCTKLHCGRIAISFLELWSRPHSKLFADYKDIPKYSSFTIVDWTSRWRTPWGRCVSEHGRLDWQIYYIKNFSFWLFDIRAGNLKSPDIVFFIQKRIRTGTTIVCFIHCMQMMYENVTLNYKDFYSSSDASWLVNWFVCYRINWEVPHARLIFSWCALSALRIANLASNFCSVWKPPEGSY